MHMFTRWYLQAVRGQFLHGTVQPALGGVDIRLVADGGGEVTLASATSSSDGKFTLGPLRSVAAGKLKATKEGYSLLADENK